MALTAVQMRAHVGQMIIEGLSRTDPEELSNQGVTLSALVLWAKLYRVNGPGSLADRREAMSAFVKKLYERVSGRTLTTVVDHVFQRHWLDILVVGEGNEVIDGTVL